MAKFAVILPAAGDSSRLKIKKRKKPFADLKGRAVWLRAANYFVNRDDVAQTLVAVAAEDRQWFTEKFKPDLAFLNIEVIEGGDQRAETVQKALAHVRSDVDFVAVHDAARPLLSKRWIDEVFQAAETTGAAIPGVAVTETLKRLDRQGTIQETVSRADLWRAQTPQVFRRQLLLDAFARRGDSAATDEAQLVEQMGEPVTVVEGSPMNIKITTYEEFKMAEALLEALPKEKPMRALHPFADEQSPPL